MDIGSLIGFVAGLTFIIISMVINGGVMPFLDPSSAMITIGGTVAVTFVANSIGSVLTAFKAIGIVLKQNQLNAKTIIEDIIALSNLARREGILALEESAQNLENQFLKKGILLIVDGTEAEQVKNILETELVYLEGRHKEVIGVWDYIGAMGPAWGMIGTLIGLILMLRELSDPTTLGPKMAVALITTFYGSFIANYICLPVSAKLNIISSGESLMCEIMIEGILSIQAGENPRIIEEKLKAFIAPTLRSSIGAQEGA